MECALYLSFCENYRRYEFLKPQFDELKGNPAKKPEFDKVRKKIGPLLTNMIPLHSRIKKLTSPTFPKIRQAILEAHGNRDRIDKIERTVPQEQANERFESILKNLQKRELHAFFRMDDAMEIVKDMHPKDKEKHIEIIKKLEKLAAFNELIDNDEIRGTVALFHPYTMASIGRYFRYKDTFKINGEHAKYLSSIFLSGSDMASNVSRFLDQLVDTRGQKALDKIGIFSKIKPYKEIMTYTELLPPGGQEFLEIVFASDYEEIAALTKAIRAKMKTARNELRKMDVIK